MPARPGPVRFDSIPGDTWFASAMGVLLVWCWMLGGVTTDNSSADEILFLSALPLLGWSAWRVQAASTRRMNWLALGLMLLVLALPAWQLLPLPHGIGMSGVARHGIDADLALAGVSSTKTHASASMFSTEHALWSLLPALALYLGALTLGHAPARKLLQLLLVLVLASAAFGFFQLSLPNDSPLLLYTSWGRNFGGVFVNPNHQGSSLTLGAVIAAALFIDGRRRARDEASWRYWLYAFLCAACVVMIPLAKGTAAMLLVMVGLVAVTVMLFGSDSSASQPGRTTRLRFAAGVSALLVIVVVLSSVFAWRHKEQARQDFAAATVHIGQQFSPLGSGVGSFVPVFAQYQELEHVPAQFVNHAHNEYVQWWLEGGVPALLVVGFGLGMFVWAGWTVLARMSSRRWRAVAVPAWSALLVLLLHSLVDYPLRTTTLMATAGLLAGLLLKSVSASKQETRTRLNRDVPPQRS